MIEMNNVCLSGIITKKRIMKRPNGTIQYVLFDLHTNEYNPQSHNYEKMVFHCITNHEPARKLAETSSNGNESIRDGNLLMLKGEVHVKVNKTAITTYENSAIWVKDFRVIRTD